jgi:hypothetical protein
MIVKKPLLPSVSATHLAAFCWWWLCCCSWCWLPLLLLLAPAAPLLLLPLLFMVVRVGPVAHQPASSFSARGGPDRTERVVGPSCTTQEQQSGAVSTEWWGTACVQAHGHKQ